MRDTNLPVKQFCYPPLEGRKRKNETQKNISLSARGKENKNATLSLDFVVVRGAEEKYLIKFFPLVAKQGMEQQCRPFLGRGQNRFMRCLRFNMRPENKCDRRTHVDCRSHCQNGKLNLEHMAQSKGCSHFCSMLGKKGKIRCFKNLKENSTLSKNSENIANIRAYLSE